jgi:Ser/Thr protein kinase RdoA (MazF antagonist)
VTPTEAVVGAIVERELGRRPTWVDRLGEGLRHETYAVGCSGAEYVVQFATEADGREDALTRGVGWYVALSDSAVPVPGVVTEGVRTHDGRGYVLVEKLPGETAKLDVSPERVRNAGRILARIHRSWSFETAGWIHFEGEEPRVTAFEAGSRGRRLERAVGCHARTLCDAGLEAAGDAVDELFEAVGGFPEAFDPVLCHGDFSPDNVVFEGDEVVGVLDFDRSRAGHRQRDLAHAANAFWMHDPGADWEIRETLYEGYREAADPGGGFVANEPLYRVETLSGAIAGMVEATGLSADEREFYDGRIRVAVDRCRERRE